VTQTVIFNDLGDILFGIPARSMPFISPDVDQSHMTMTAKQLTQRAILNDFHSMPNEFINILLLAICAVLILTMTSSLHVFLLGVPAFLFIYSFIISTAYVYLINTKFKLTKNSQTFNDLRTSLLVPLAMSLIGYYEKWIGSLLGGTQWLVVALRQFGAKIDDDVIIEDMNCLEDVHLITIGSHVRISSTSRVQVGFAL
jgi:hypothetical protein